MDDNEDDNDDDIEDDSQLTGFAAKRNELSYFLFWLSNILDNVVML